MCRQKYGHQAARVDVWPSLPTFALTVFLCSCRTRTLSTSCYAQLTQIIGCEGQDTIIPTGQEGMGPIAKGMLDRIVGIQTEEIEQEWSVGAHEMGRR
jgi:hypothetical protein